MNVRVVYEPTPIRHIAVQCPHCGKWFSGLDALVGVPSKDLRYDHDIKYADFECPVCNKEFGNIVNGADVNIKEVYTADECYKDCLKQKVIWE